MCLRCESFQIVQLIENLLGLLGLLECVVEALDETRVFAPADIADIRKGVITTPTFAKQDSFYDTDK